MNADDADMIRSRSSCFARVLPRATEAHGIDECEQFVEHGIAYRRRRHRGIQRHDARAANFPLMVGQSSGSDAPNSAESSPAECAVGTPRDSAPASAGKAYAKMEPRNSSTAVRSSCSATAMSWGSSGGIRSEAAAMSTDHAADTKGLAMTHATSWMCSGMQQ